MFYFPYLKVIVIFFIVLQEKWKVLYSEYRHTDE